MSEHDLKQLWKDQAQPQFQAARFQRTIRIRNIVEYAAGGIAIAIFGVYCWLLSGLLMRAGSVLCLIGAAFVLAQLHRRGSARAIPAESLASPCLIFHRVELVRQRDALRTAWAWYLAPLVPGIAMLLWAAQAGSTNPDAALYGAFTGVLIAGIFLAIALLNLRAARKLQDQIDALDRQV